MAATNQSACSTGVDDDMIGVAMNYICCAILAAAAFHLHKRHGWQRAHVAIKTEVGMSLGYLFGGLVHHLFANRASGNDCASLLFYPLFALSYSTMIYSGWCWLGIATRLQRAVLATRCVWAVSGVLIVTGASWCQVTVRLLPGVRAPDTCPASAQPTCDQVMFLGEGIFYIVWCATWLVAALDVRVHCATCGEHLLNWLAPLVLLYGPGQIIAVGLLPLLLYPTEEAVLKAEEWYCGLHTGVTYIVAVLVTHVITTVLSDRLFARRARAELLWSSDQVDDGVVDVVAARRLGGAWPDQNRFGASESASSTIACN